MAGEGEGGRVEVTYDREAGLGSYRIAGVAYGDSGTYQCLAYDQLNNTLAHSDVGSMEVMGNQAEL